MSKVSSCSVTFDLGLLRNQTVDYVPTCALVCSTHNLLGGTEQSTVCQSSLFTKCRHRCYYYYFMWVSVTVVISRPSTVIAKNTATLLFYPGLVYIAVWYSFSECLDCNRTPCVCADSAWSSHSRVWTRQGDAHRDTGLKQNKRVWGTVSVDPGFSTASQGSRRTPI